MDGVRMRRWTKDGARWSHRYHHHSFSCIWLILLVIIIIKSIKIHNGNLISDQKHSHPSTSSSTSSSKYPPSSSSFSPSLPFLDSIVAPPATHQVTPVHPLRVNVAHSALRSWISSVKWMSSTVEDNFHLWNDQSQKNLDWKENHINDRAYQAIRWCGCCDSSPGSSWWTPGRSPDNTFVITIL